MMRLCKLFAAVAALMSAANPAPAHAEIIADATGFDAGYVPDFWGVQFISGNGYIQSATFTLSSTAGFFDFDGSLFLNFTFPPGIPGVEPVLGAMSGLSTGDITYPTAGGQPLGHPTTLTFTFAPGSFAPGDWFRFSADVDGGGVSGGSFGTLGTSFSVVMSDGQTFSAPFVTLSDNQSEATLDVPSAVPAPATLPLFATGLGMLGLMAMRRRRLRSGMGSLCSAQKYPTMSHLSPGCSGYTYWASGGGSAA
jgi:hypothetical protein